MSGNGVNDREYSAIFKTDQKSIAGSRFYTSMADTDEVIDEALAKFDNVFSNMQI